MRYTSLQFSYQVVDVQLSRNDEMRERFFPDLVHRQKRCSPVSRGQVSAHGSVVQEDCGVSNGTEDSRIWSSDTRDSCGRLVG